MNGKTNTFEKLGTFLKIIPEQMKHKIRRLELHEGGDRDTNRRVDFKCMNEKNRTVHFCAS